MSLIKTAFSSHKKCFLCRRTDSLHEVRNECIFYAYLELKLLIKSKSRICSRHLDLNKNIRKDQFQLIPFALKPVDKYLKIVLDSMVQFCKNKPSNVFDQFEDIEKLSDVHCIKITRWSKSTFIKFAKYITSINETKNRTKDQAIALYLYWLHRGIDQTTLSYFKNNTSQQDISNYLAQIRNAIYKDFVPFFLGASSRSREFFINHNTETARILYDLKSDDLVAVADGTYCRIEKSANNDLQYKSWSGQKKDSLIKPFLISCADGYIIDCYGPFAANENDSRILDKILRTDNDLIQIFKTKKTFIFIDRCLLIWLF